MIDQIDVTKVLFLDIETVSGKATYQDMDETFQYLWAQKAPGAMRRYGEEMTEEEIADSYVDRAAIFAEFGKIVCISVGAVYRDKDKRLKIRLKSFADRDEATLLKNFSFFFHLRLLWRGPVGTCLLLIAAALGFCAVSA